VHQHPDKATEPQVKFIKDLLERKQTPNEETVDRLWKALRIWEDPEELGITKAKASEIIDYLKERPNKPGAKKGNGKFKAQAIAQDIPTGRYAVNNEEGELRFYQLWRPKDNPDVFRLYVQHGPDSSPVFGTAMASILKKIAVDPEAAAIRYGHEIGACSICGRRLTNRISRELGIGPVCGGRMREDFGSRVSAAREAIIARGEDPDEEIEDDAPTTGQRYPHKGQPGDGCDKCGLERELYYNTATGLSLCEQCDLDTEPGFREREAAADRRLQEEGYGDA